MNNRLRRGTLERIREEGCYIAKILARIGVTMEDFETAVKIYSKLGV